MSEEINKTNPPPFIDDGGHESEWTLKFERRRIHMYGEKDPRNEWMYTVHGFKLDENGEVDNISGNSIKSWEDALNNFITMLKIKATTIGAKTIEDVRNSQLTIEDTLKLKSVTPTEAEMEWSGYEKGLELGKRLGSKCIT